MRLCKRRNEAFHPVSCLSGCVAQWPLGTAYSAAVSSRHCCRACCLCRPGPSVSSVAESLRAELGGQRFQSKWKRRTGMWRAGWAGQGGHTPFVPCNSFTRPGFAEWLVALCGPEPGLGDLGDMCVHTAWRGDRHLPPPPSQMP